MDRVNHSSVSSAPSCPKCKSLMVLRTNRGSGESFWGCKRFPECRGTLPIVSGNSPPEPKIDYSTPSEFILPVDWVEGAGRNGYIPEYVTVGAMPGVLRNRLGEVPEIKQLLSQCVLLYHRDRSRQGATQYTKLISALLRKMLQRGCIPLPTLGVEHKALQLHSLLDESVRDLSDEGMMVGWEMPVRMLAWVNTNYVLAAITQRSSFFIDPEFDIVGSDFQALFQSPEESWFLNKWVSEALGETAAHWFTPQASLDTLLVAGNKVGNNELGKRRIDFLFFHPGDSHPIGIEIDGPEHIPGNPIDYERDKLLRKLGIDVFRVTNNEINQQGGSVLDQIKNRCEFALNKLKNFDDTSNKFASFLIDCSNAAKLQFAIAQSIGWGWLTADRYWTICLDETNPVYVASVLDLLRLLSAYDRLYGDRSTPKCCFVRCKDGPVIAWQMSEGGDWQEIDPQERQGDNVSIAVESNTSPYHHMSYCQSPDIIIRPAYLPVKFSIGYSASFSRRPIAPKKYRELKPVLTNFLQNIFRKYQFRPMQGESIHKALRQEDCVVLLPTGAGKSIIYQLAGLLMPGITIVVDPIVSLIEDQAEGLQLYGIDRAVPIARRLSSADEYNQLLLQVTRGEYLFILLSPERLQIPKFRSLIKEGMVQNTLINLAVIDEAHCVSEWGHDFRPAYLNLGTNIRNLCEDSAGKPPPLLALTGTASRAVLRDLLADLNFDRNRSDSLIRPNSFNRPELEFGIVLNRPPNDPNDALRSVLNGLPSKFNFPIAELFRLSDRHTNSGIVFVPTVNGRVYGLISVKNTVQRITNTEVTVYSGGAPKGFDLATWDDKKRKNARRFKNNDVSILVATKAFGMGIDKSNIRYTVHFGMPGSLENFYQEAGRAGRDQKKSCCVIVFSEYDPNRSDLLLDSSLSLPELRRNFASIDSGRKTSDDVTRAIWFHLQGFIGVEEEINGVEAMLSELGDFTSTKSTIELPLNNDNGTKTNQEKALCRLLRIGVISDYEVDFGAKKYIVTVEQFNLEKYKKRLLDYITAVQPAMAPIIADQLETIHSVSPHKSASSLARVLITFVYDTIERSRRRMIQESVLLARSALLEADDKHVDETIRTRLLDYLQEGLGAEQIDQLLDEQKISLMDWFNLIDKCQTSIDAGELRGLCIRALESQPDHPGLLLTRAVSETMCSDHDDGVSSQGISSALGFGIKKYNLTEDSVRILLASLFKLAKEERANELGVPLVVALLSFDDSEPNLLFTVELGLSKAKDFRDDRIAVAVSVHRLRKMMNSLDLATSRIISQFRKKNVLRAIGWEN